MSKTDAPRVGDSRAAWHRREWVTVQEASSLLGISRERVRQLVAERKLPVCRVGRTVWLRRGAVLCRAARRAAQATRSVGRAAEREERLLRRARREDARNVLDARLAPASFAPEHSAPPEEHVIRVTVALRIDTNQGYRETTCADLADAVAWWNAMAVIFPGEIMPARLTDADVP